VYAPPLEPLEEPPPSGLSVARPGSPALEQPKGRKRSATRTANARTVGTDMRQDLHACHVQRAFLGWMGLAGRDDSVETVVRE
jgi:hypothetical protein